QISPDLMPVPGSSHNSTSVCAWWKAASVAATCATGSAVAPVVGFCTTPSPPPRSRISTAGKCDNSHLSGNSDTLTPRQRTSEHCCAHVQRLRNLAPVVRFSQDAAANMGVEADDGGARRCHQGGHLVEALAIDAELARLAARLHMRVVPFANARVDPQKESR